MAIDLSLYLVTDPVHTRSRRVIDVVTRAIAGGVTIVQLRDPFCSTRALMAEAEALQALLRPAGIPLIINNRVDVAFAVGAAGVHLGQDDMDPRAARRLMGDAAVIGLSVGNEAEFNASRGMLAAADYIGVGPVMATATKADVGDAIGYAGLAAMRARTTLPLVAIGGIKEEHAADCIRAGAHGVAVVTSIMAAPEPDVAARRLMDEIRKGKST
jgi:thiamine-phosphate pyrophosphorylase